VEGFGGFLDLRKHAGKNLKARILFIAQTVGTALKDANLVVETLDEAKRDFVLRTAIGGDAIPVTIDQRRELLVGLEPPIPRFRCLARAARLRVDPPAVLEMFWKRSAEGSTMPVSPCLRTDSSISFMIAAGGFSRSTFSR